MPHQDESCILEDALKVLTVRKLEELKSAITILLNAAMKLEREQFLEAAALERWLIATSEHVRRASIQILGTGKPSALWQEAAHFCTVRGL